MRQCDRKTISAKGISIFILKYSNRLHNIWELELRVEDKITNGLPLKYKDYIDNLVDSNAIMDINRM